jgi:hypothetical protein
MPTNTNIITNADFSEGLNDWTHSTGVITSSDPEAPGVRLPGAGYLAQWFGDATLLGHNLYFFCTPLSSTGFRLQVRLVYTDGSHQSHDTHAVVENPLYFQCRIPVNNDLSLRQLEIINMDLHEGATVILSFFYLYGELTTGAEPESGTGGGPGGMRGMAGFDSRMMGARFLDLEKKLDRILERLGPQDLPSKSKAAAKSKESK